MNLAELVVQHADARPDHVALSFRGEEVTYAEYAERAGRLGRVLQELGIDRGGRVLMYGRNSSDYLIAYTACAWIGAVFAPVHHGFKHFELSYVASSARATVAIVDEDMLDDYCDHAAALELLPRVVLVRSDVEYCPDRDVPGMKIMSLHAAVAAAFGPADMVDMASADPVLICYTSGSTSRPKPVLRSHRGETWNAETYREVWDLRATDRALMSLPLSWVYGLSTLGQALLAAGSTIVVLTHFNPVAVVKAITDKKITLFGGTNTMYVKMLDVYDRHGGDFSGLRNCYIGGEPSNDSTVERFEALYGSRLWQGYAATEAAPILATYPTSDLDAPKRTCGRLIPGAEILLVDENLEPVDPGQTGEALIRCPGSMIAYLDEPALNAERVTPDGWFRTGDLVVERDGYYFVVGRKSDMIIRGGSNIAPAEVESELTKIPGVLDATVVGAPDPEYGEKVVALLTTRAAFELSDERITEVLSHRLASYKLPSVYLRNLPLPESTNGKRNRRGIRDVVLAMTDGPGVSPGPVTRSE